ncbi:RNA-binding transcriptional accessory protein [Flavobacteriales bacterium]|nr:RNA-binding transcriptional accessory protein [Flavobacteriales bacterium]
MLEEKISKALNISSAGVKAVVSLYDADATIPFIARYRKEMTGGLDEVQIGNIVDEYESLKSLLKRREAILKSMSEQDVLSQDLKKQIESTWDLNELEDIYLPFKPKKKTRASIARDLGLETLAKIIMSQNDGDLINQAKRFVKGDLKTPEEAIEKSLDIIAEWVSESKASRDITRKAFSSTAKITSKKKKATVENEDKYSAYFDWSELLKKCASHRFLAIKRGEAEGVLSSKIEVDQKELQLRLERVFVKQNNEAGNYIKLAVKDAIKRLLLPSISKEFEQNHKLKSDQEAIKVFSQNLRQLLLAAPLGNKKILAIDPGFRSGCKLVCLNENGELKHNETIYPHPPKKDAKKAVNKIGQLVEAYKIEAIAIGNGTAGRETENLVSRMKFKTDVQVFVVNEAGASIYSASSVARKEFPNYDVTVRGSVSIGRRLMDPMAELVKIDPKSIGVGQYQHDVNQKMLEEALGRDVEFCVNKVGVDLNTASEYLLAHVSGLNATIAQNIVAYRSTNGAFTSRNELLKVDRLGKKSFEQSAGFLRIKEAKHPLDNSAVHPEVYKLVESIAKAYKVQLKDLVGNDSLLEEIEWSNFVSATVGLPTLMDIKEELKKPGRDPRKAAKVLKFDENVRSIKDLSEGQILPGVVSNITNFGAFVDVGAKQDGLVHISQITEQFISNPADVLHLNQPVKVKVVSIDIAKNRVGFSMKGIDQPRYAW